MGGVGGIHVESLDQLAQLSAVREKMILECDFKLGAPRVLHPHEVHAICTPVPWYRYTGKQSFGTRLIDAVAGRRSPAAVAVAAPVTLRRLRAVRPPSEHIRCAPRLPA